MNRITKPSRFLRVVLMSTVPLAVAAVNLAAQAASPGLTIPAGTAVAIRTIDAIDSKHADLDRDYAASLADPIVVNNVQIAPQGASAVLRVEQAQSAKLLWGRASLKLRLTAITVNGQRVVMESGDVSSQSGSQGAKSAKAAGAGAAGGAGIGALAGGGLGAAIGAGIGAVAGATAGALSGQRVKVAAETRLTFTLAVPALIAVSANAPR